MRIGAAGGGVKARGWTRGVARSNGSFPSLMTAATRGASGIVTFAGSRRAAGGGVNAFSGRAGGAARGRLRASTAGVTRGASGRTGGRLGAGFSTGGVKTRRGLGGGAMASTFGKGSGFGV